MKPVYAFDEEQRLVQIDRKKCSNKKCKNVLSFNNVKGLCFSCQIKQVKK